MATEFPMPKPAAIRLPRLLTSVSSPSEAAAIAARLDWIDVYRGLAIVLVAVIHTCSSCQRMRRSPDTAWFVFAEISRLLQFAVPAFLMLSALVLTRSLLRDASPLRYMRNRARTVLWPLLVWSVLCVPYVHSLNRGIAWHKAACLVWTGQADFHLYFLRVLLQLCLFLPFLLPIMRRRPAFWKIAAATAALTVFTLLTNRFYFHITTAASWIFWYFPPVALGLWLGTQNERWEEIARRHWPSALFITLASGALYVPLALQSMEGTDVRALLYPLSWWIYSCAVAFLLFCLAFAACQDDHRWAHSLRSTMAVLRELGRYSLQIYLLHPVVLMILQKQMDQLGTRTYASAGDLMLLFASRLSLCLLWPMLIAWSADRLRLTSLLFGR